MDGEGLSPAANLSTATACICNCKTKIRSTSFRTHPISHLNNKVCTRYDNDITRWTRFFNFHYDKKNDRSNVSSKVRSSSSQCRTDMQVMSNKTMYFTHKESAYYFHILENYNLKALFSKALL